jgi:hypothetical protein
MCQTAADHRGRACGTILPPRAGAAYCTNLTWLVVFLLSFVLVPALIVPFGLVALEGAWLTFMGNRLARNRDGLATRLADWASTHRRHPLAPAWLTTAGDQVIGGIILMGGVGFCVAAVAAALVFRGGLL